MMFVDNLKRWFHLEGTERTRRPRRTRRRVRRNWRSNTLRAWLNVGMGLFLVGCAGSKSFTNKTRDASFESLTESMDSGDRLKAYQKLAKAAQAEGKDREFAMLLLMKGAANETSPIARASAVTSLTNFQEPEALDVVLGAMSDNHPLVRVEAARTLGRQYSNLNGRDRLVPSTLAVTYPDRAAKAKELLKTMATKDTAIDARVAATESIAGFADQDARLTLVECLQDTQITVVHAAANGLQQQTGQNFGKDHEAWAAYFENRTVPSTTNLANQRTGAIVR